MAITYALAGATYACIYRVFTSDPFIVDGVCIDPAAITQKSSPIHAHSVQMGTGTGTMGNGGYFHGRCGRITSQDQLTCQFDGGCCVLGSAWSFGGLALHQHITVQGHGMGSSEKTHVTAREAGLKSCRNCGKLQKITDTRDCQRCGSYVVARSTMGVQRVWAFLLVGIIAYIPANIMPIMRTQSFSGDTEDTIYTGIVSLFSMGSYFVALIVFIASICIPVMKFGIIIMLALSLQFEWDMSDHTRHRLHTLTEFIGRWSMIDVFVVAVLAALIQLGSIMTVTPGIGINAFAASVVFTMLAASSLDPRLLWDIQDRHELSDAGKRVHS